MFPSRDQVGLPIHFHSSMISPSASRMLLRMLANVLPRQSVSSAISSLIRSDGFIRSLCLELVSYLKSRLTGSVEAGNACKVAAVGFRPLHLEPAVSPR